ncbi:MAG TPA: hypothetical protein VKR58_02675, partial [Aquella sp.]|nr:hypothetical protein [Aquella sp.]
MELEIQKWLRNPPNPNESIDLNISLLAAIGVYMKRHNLYPNLCTFKYDMIEADFSNPITRECRGIILDQSQNWKVVARAY